jgi:glycosyltransferase involved in cell wall biosynthesis
MCRASVRIGAIDLARIKVIIPALNEENSIGLVLADIPRDLVDEVIVVSNGSSDATEDRAARAGATVLREKRRGYGWACMKGVDHLASDPPDIVVFLDGDYSDHADELLRVVEPILQDRADFVIGSRTAGNSEPGALLPQARIGNWLACSIIQWISGVRFSDLGPFRAIRYRDLVAMQMEEMTYGWTVEMQVKAVRADLQCAEVPVSYRKRIGDSKVTGTVTGTVKASARILWLLGRYVLSR